VRRGVLDPLPIRSKGTSEGRKLHERPNEMGGPFGRDGARESQLTKKTGPDLLARRGENRDKVARATFSFKDGLALRGRDRR